MRFPIAVALLVAMGPAQVGWQSFPGSSRLPDRFGYGICHHEAIGRTVLFGGAAVGSAANRETWEWDGVVWQQRSPASSPPGMSAATMVYDSLRQCIVLVSPTLQVWEYDGNHWTARTPAVSPPVRSGFGLAFDRQRGRTVLFGGVDSTYQHRNDTWEWDGGQWHNPTPAVAPPVRSGACLAFDPASQAVLLWGGGEGYPWPSTPIQYQDHWQWDGAAWTLIAATTPVPADSAIATTHLGLGRVLLFPSAYAASGPLVHWQWDGSNWSPVNSPQGPNRYTTAVPYDPGRDRLVWFGGYELSAMAQVPGMTGVWEWDRSTWTTIGGSQPPRPAARFGHGFAWLPTTQTCVLFGGSNGSLLTDTWEWNGSSWFRRQPATSPPPRHTTRMATHASRGEVVLFGGQGPGGVGLGDTWVWDGLTWTLRVPPFSPPARYGHGLAGDTGRDRVVLFGGTVGFSSTATTYEWDGITWVQRAPLVVPPARTEANLAYDTARGRTVLVGGLGRNDAYEYDGTTWSPIASGPPTGWPMLAYDEARGRTVAFGNDGQAWEWDGSQWAQRVVSPSPPGRSSGGFAYDAARRRLVLCGGINTGTKDDVWDYGPTSPASWTPFGAGCAGTLGVPTLDSIGVPWLGASCTLRVGPVPAGQFAVLAFGSRWQWGAVTLPLGLGPYGMPGCTLFAGGDDLRLLLPLGGAAELVVAIPNQPAALGATFDVQAAVVDPGANAAGLVMTGAGTWTLGGR